MLCVEAFCIYSTCTYRNFWPSINIIIYCEAQKTHEPFEFQTKNLNSSQYFMQRKQRNKSTSHWLLVIIYYSFDNGHLGNSSNENGKYWEKNTQINIKVQRKWCKAMGNILKTSGFSNVFCITLKISRNFFMFKYKPNRVPNHQNGLWPKCIWNKIFLDFNIFHGIFFRRDEKIRTKKMR